MSSTECDGGTPRRKGFDRRGARGLTLAGRGGAAREWSPEKDGVRPSLLRRWDRCVARAASQHSGPMFGPKVSSMPRWWALFAVPGMIACGPAQMGAVEGDARCGQGSAEVVAPRDPTLLAIMDLVNRARLSPRTCGYEGDFPATGILLWDRRLAVAAQFHSDEMAEHDYFGHVGPDGSEAGDRVRARGYYWSAVGENIAAGPPTPEQVVAKWLSNAGYCANLMSPRFVHMG